MVNRLFFFRLLIVILSHFILLTSVTFASPLHLAAKNGDTTKARILIDKGTNINSRSSFGHTPLHVALAYGHESMANLLIEKGADVGAVDKRGRTPFRVATLRGYKEMALRVLPMSSSGKNKKKDWHLMLGGGGAYVPEYEGSDKNEFTGIPLIEISWRDRVFLSSMQGAGVNILKSDWLKIGVAINYYGSREEDDSNDLRGLGKVDGGFDGGMFGSLIFGDTSLDVKFSQDISDNYDGFLITFGGSHNIQFNDKTEISFSIGTTYAGEDYMNTYFDVSTSQSVNSGLPVYDAGSGIKDVGMEMSIAYELSKHWAVLGVVNFARLLNDAKESPIVKNVGSENQFTSGLGLAFKY